MYYTDNPVLDAMRYDAERQAEMDRLPRCCECGEPITDDYCYEINDSLICTECMERNYKKDTDDFVNH
jgi:formylmethanofuran dehydrogenase subunit E